ncbi:MAG: 1-phosphofructokinase [Anaerolineae bacterium]|nr:1-phosphofructokinase [Anaerolineae bacterium]
MIHAAALALNPAVDWTLHVQDFKPSAVNRAGMVESHAGGKGVNVAAYLAQLGCAVAVTGFLGEENSRPFEQLFSGLGMLDRCVRLPGSTRMGIKIVDPSKGTTTDVNLPGLSPSPAEQAQLVEEVERLAGECGWLALSGSLPPGMADDTYARLTQRIRAMGCRVALDTSGAALEQALSAEPDFIKPNRAELEQVMGRRLDSPLALLEAARILMGRGIGLVVISMGEEGAWFVESEQALLALPPKVTPLSTVGAGDALVAGVIWARLRGLGLEKTARAATALAVGKLAFAGALLPDAAVLADLEQQVEIRG